jgi:hypothetical protein
MTKKYLKLLALIAIGVFLAACPKGEEEAPITPQQQQPSQQGAPSIMMPAGEPQVVVPDSVKGKWSAVVITIEDKVANTSEDVKIPINSDYTIKDSNVKIKVGDFLPDFKMDGITITSSSNELKNPAVRVIVYEGDEEIFKGWLYSKFPAIHPFQHEKYSLLLKEGVKS